jgi:hypothetical protein
MKNSPAAILQLDIAVIIGTDDLVAKKMLSQKPKSCDLAAIKQKEFMLLWHRSDPKT